MRSSLLSRAGLTLLEATIAMAIFASVMAAILGTMRTGTEMKTSISTTDDAGDKASRAVQSVASELRYSDINRIYLDGTAWTTVQSGSDYYSFKVCTGFQVTNGGEVASLDRMVKYDRGLVLRFSPNGDGSATLYRTVLQLDANGVPTATVESERPLATGLAWEYVPSPGQTARRGFQIVQLDPSQASVVGNRLMVHATAFVGSGLSSGDARPWRAVETAVYLRSSMFDATGLMPPVITSAKTASGNLGAPFIYDIVASNDPTRFAASSLPAGLSWNVYTGRVSGTPATQGTFEAVVSAYNDAGADAEAITMTIRGPLPEITSALALNVVAGAPVDYLITATNTPTSYATTGLPSWLLSSSTTGAITGTAPTSVTTTTTYSATISATNVNGTQTALLRIQVSPAPPTPPVLTTASPLLCTINAAWSYRLTATGNPSSWVAVGLPSWLSLNTATGVLSGTPTYTGAYTFQAQASNEAGAGPEGTVTVTVQDPLPIITSATTATAEVGIPFTYQITATNSPTSYRATVGGSALPAWLALDTALGRLTGTPTTAGTLALEVAALNSIGTGSSSLSLSIAPLRLPTVSLPAQLDATVGVLFSHTVSASPSVTAYAVSGLPGGVTLTSASAGTISGRPTAEGTYSVQVYATNSSGTGSATTQLVVVANPNLPVLTLSADQDASAKFQITGTVAPGQSGSTLATSSFTVTDNQGGLSLRRGWVASEAAGHGQDAALQANEFLLSKNNTSGTVSITVTITDSAGGVGTLTRTY